MTKMYIHAINSDGKRTEFTISEAGTGYSLSWEGSQIDTFSDDIPSMDRAEEIIKDTGYHMEELVTNWGDWSSAISFNRVDDQTVILTFWEWMDGRYVQIGAEERYSIDCAAVEYGYC